MRIITILSLLFIFSCAHRSKKAGDVKIISSSDLKWTELRYLKKDKSLIAANLWGDFKGDKSAGFLVQYPEDFISTFHAHDVSYRGIVIDGQIHSGDPKASKLWMPNSSYWTWPAGRGHSLAASGGRNIVFVETDQGPFSVKPIKESFNGKEYPYNIHASNILWKKKRGFELVDTWKDKNGIISGSLLKFKDVVSLDIENSKLVIIKGEVFVKGQYLKPGSLIYSDGYAKLAFGCKVDECIVYFKPSNS